MTAGRFFYGYRRPKLFGKRLSRMGIHHFAHFLTRLEVNGVLRRNRNALAGTRIAADTGRAVVQREGAKTADFNPAAARDCLSHFFKEDAHCFVS